MGNCCSMGPHNVKGGGGGGGVKTQKKQKQEDTGAPDDLMVSVWAVLAVVAK